MEQSKFTIDLSKLNLNREDWKKVGEECVRLLSAKIDKTTEELSLDHVYNMDELGGDPELYVFEISHPWEKNEKLLFTYVFKEKAGKNLIFDVEGVI
jgi:hypothetical protein